MKRKSTHSSHHFISFFRSQLFLAFIMICSSVTMAIGQHENRISRQIDSKETLFQKLQKITPFNISQGRTEGAVKAKEMIPGATLMTVSPSALDYILAGEEHLLLEMPFENESKLTLKLQRADVFSSTFQLFTATDPHTPYPYERGAYYWGSVEGSKGSLVALSFTRDEIMGFIEADGVHYTLGKIEKDQAGTHVLYRTDELPADPGINCFTDDSYDMGIRVEDENPERAGPDNCVKMYIQVDYDIFVQKGGVQEAADYVNGAFSLVSVMYANEEIELVVNEMFVWNVADPFTSTSTSTLLTQFRNHLNGNYNGDLAHLVGYAGGGGIAYLDVLCNSVYGVGYSGVNSTYNQLPAYSWTIMVLTHEIGHNLGSPHTHACAWNGNNTAIDGCGPAAGYSEGCNAALPAQGTVMSYCHLIGGVGISMTLGFGDQPGDRIRNRVYNASCLETCGPPIQFDAGITAINDPIPFPCSATTSPVVVLKNFGAATLTSVMINYRVDNGSTQQYAWTGSLQQGLTANVTLPSVSYGTGSHTFRAYTSNPNGQTDEVSSNDESIKSFTYIVDWCVCNEAVAALSPNPLTHVGSGFSTANVSLGTGSKHASFTISNLNAKTNGPNNSRFNELAVVTYVDGNGVTQTYGSFSGSQTSTVNVSIQGFVSSISVRLSNSLNNNYNGTLSISFSPVDYCSGQPPCGDTDGDGVCNEDDICPGFDDNLIGTACNDGDACTQNDVYTSGCICSGTFIPGCGTGCNEVTSNFSPNPLNHTGAGSSSSLVTIPPGNTDISFVISGLSARTSGNPSKRFIEQATVNYVNGSGSTVLYGVFRGDQVSSVNVSIAGAVQSVTVSLADAYDGNSSDPLSITMSAVTSCSGSGALQGVNEAGDIHEAVLYPNPVSGDLFIRWDYAPHKAAVRVYTTLGVMVGSYAFEDVPLARIPVASLGLSSGQLIFVEIQADGRSAGIQRVMVAK